MILSLSRAWESTKAFEFLVLIIFSIVPISFHPLLFHRPLICVFISKLHTTYITYFENSFSDSIPHTLLHWWSNVLLMQLILQFCDFEILDAFLCFFKFKFKKKINPTFDIQHPKFWITKSAEDLRRTQFKFTKCVVIYVKCISQKKYSRMVFIR